jgi:CubicO group peptidase (beta-lactamase class C family)
VNNHKRRKRPHSKTPDNFHDNRPPIGACTRTSSYSLLPEPMKAVLFLTVTLLTSFCSLAAESEGLPRGRPTAEGFSPERLERLHRIVNGFVESGQHAGIVTLLARDGKIIDSAAYGYADIEKKVPMRQDTIFRIYSMSKIITSVAAVILMEDGKFVLDDPVSKYIPELKDMKVMAGGTAESPALAAAQRPITIMHLLTHTSGLIYDFDGDDAIHQLYKNAHLWSGPDLKTFVEKVSKLPLKHQPGNAFTYGINTDVLGRLVEVASGKSFAEFLEERIFRPLGMKDTGFSVPEEKRSRVARTYQHGEGGKFAEAPALLTNWTEAGMPIYSGGAGLFSTVGDYAIFAQMLLNRGRYGGAQILGRKTVDLMTSDHTMSLPGNPRATQPNGFGLGVEVQHDLGFSSILGSPGAFGWYGAATTYCRIDRNEKIVAIAFAQHFPFNEHRFFEKFADGYYQALVDAP